MYDIPFNYNAYQESLKREEEYRNDCRELQKEHAKTQMHMQTTMGLTRWKSKVRQEEKEMERAIYEEVTFDRDGRVIVCTCNAQVQVQPRVVSNIRWPHMYIAANSSNLVEKVCILEYEIGEESKQIFLDPKKVGSATYVQKKLTEEGIDIFAPSLAKAKEYVLKLISKLIQNAQKTILPGEPGWMLIEGKFSFAGKDRMTWKNIRKMI